MDYLKLGHQINLTGDHKGEFENCLKCSERIKMREENIKKMKLRRVK